MKFGSVKLTQDNMSHYELGHQLYNALGLFIDQTLDDGEASKNIALTKLKESSMWFNQGLAEDSEKARKQEDSDDE